MTPTLPDWLDACVADPSDALVRTVRSGTRIGSGLGTAEPSTFYAGLLDHVREHDLHDLEIRQGLFLEPHPIVVGDALEVRTPSWPGPLGTVAERGADAVRLRRLLGHVEELERRGIVFTSAFLGPALNAVIPGNPIVRVLAARLAGRNRVTAGLVRYQHVHFPDAASALATDGHGELTIDLLVQPMTWPSADGRLSFGLANGVGGDVLPLLERSAENDDGATLLLYLNRQLPFTTGIDQTVELQRLRPLADRGRLVVVIEDVEPPGTPPESAEIGEVQRKIADHVTGHIGASLERMIGRALQVGIGTISSEVVRSLDDIGWRGRGYTEMLDPGTYDLLDQGLIEGTHMIDPDGRRRTIDNRLACTFAMGERGSDFPSRLDGDERILMTSAARLLQPSAFHGGMGINNVMAIDLAGNVNATSRDHHPYSGVGGLATIVRGLAVGGISYLCLPSTHGDIDGNRRSSIMPSLPPGTPVALTPADLMGTREQAGSFLVTEHGVAALHGRRHDEFLRAVIAVADPAHADHLREVAWDRYRVRA